MRILYIHQYFAVPESNAGTRSYEMARRLVKAGHEVTMVTSSAFLPEGWVSGNGWHRKTVAGIKLEALHLPYSNETPFLKRIAVFILFALRATLKARAIRCDVVFATSTPLTVALPGAFSAWKNKVPMVFEVRDLWPEFPIMVGAIKNPVAATLARKLERWAYKNARHVVALSPGMARWIADCGCPDKNITVIPNACDPELFEVPAEQGLRFRERHSWLGDKPLVIYAGTLGMINGVGYMVRLARAMLQINEEVRFVVVGKGMEYEKVKTLAMSTGVLDKNFFLLPPVPKNEMPEVLSAADMALSLSLSVDALWQSSVDRLFDKAALSTVKTKLAEVVGSATNKFYDALAAQTPIAINYQGWQARIIESSGAGLVLNPESPREAALSINDALQDKAWIATAKAAAKGLSAGEFNRDTLTKKLEKVLLEAVGV